MMNALDVLKIVIPITAPVREHAHMQWEVGGLLLLSNAAYAKWVDVAEG